MEVSLMLYSHYQLLRIPDKNMQMYMIQRGFLCQHMSRPRFSAPAAFVRLEPWSSQTMSVHSILSILLIN